MPRALTVRGIAAGLLAAAAGIGVATLIAGLTGPAGSPVIAVGELAIDHTPPPVKNFAISAFGSHDKTVLLAGIAVVLAIYAGLVGWLGVRDRRLGLAGVTIFGVIGLIAAATRPTFAPRDLLPTLAGTATAAVALVLLIRAAERGAEATPAGDGDGRRPDDRPRLAVSQRPRREFLTLGAAAAGTAVVGGVGGRLLGERTSVSAAQRALRLPRPARLAPALPPGSRLPVPGLSPFVTSNASFYRVDTALVLPQVSPSSWRLRIHGMVARELTINFHELLRQPLIEDYITLTCVSNPVGGPYIGNARWLGASLGALLRRAGIRAGADQLYCTSVDGFTCGTPVQTAMDGRHALLALAMNGQPLPVGHGFPVRAVVPGLYGYVSACKWITDIEVTTYAANTAYWAQRGWAPQAVIKTESRIDVPGGGTIRKGPTKVAGVAWAQHRGIDAVEVRIDRGPWRHATLAAVPGIDTWRQWVLDWDAGPGTHTIEARATDGTGHTQTAASQPPEPNGASGYPVVQVNVTA